MRIEGKFVLESLLEYRKSKDKNVGAHLIQALGKIQRETLNIF